MIMDAAYVVAIGPDGTILNTELADPFTKPAIVVEFSLAEFDVDYIAIYHDDLDCWEVFGDGATKVYEIAQKRCVTL
jgi:hypothetical protein